MDLFSDLSQELVLCNSLEIKFNDLLVLFVSPHGLVFEYLDFAAVIHVLSSLLLHFEDGLSND